MDTTKEQEQEQELKVTYIRIPLYGANNQFVGWFDNVAHDAIIPGYIVKRHPEDTDFATDEIAMIGDVCEVVQTETEADPEIYDVLAEPGIEATSTETEEIAMTGYVCEVTSTETDTIEDNTGLVYLDENGVAHPVPDSVTSLPGAEWLQRSIDPAPEPVKVVPGWWEYLTGSKPVLPPQNETEPEPVIEERLMGVKAYDPLCETTVSAIITAVNENNPDAIAHLISTEAAVDTSTPVDADSGESSQTVDADSTESDSSVPAEPEHSRTCNIM